MSFNANGVRSAASKGFFDWFAQQDTDVLCLQETKAQEHQLTEATFRPPGYRAWFKDASTKKGYSGVAVYSRREPDEVRTSLGWAPFDDEGRYIEARFGNLSVVSFYIPSGSSGELRQGFKFEVMDWLRPVLDGWLTSGRDYVLCGDWNIVRSATGAATRRTQVVSRRSAPGSTAFAANPRAGSTRTVHLSQRVRTTPGGAHVARRVRTTSDGASTISSRRRRCDHVCAAAPFIPPRAFRITHPSSSTTPTDWREAFHPPRRRHHR
jgi:exodeoxyribonuclease III